MVPQVSVIIPTLGRESLRRAVDSALQQGLKVEVLVVDDSVEQSVPSIPVPGVTVLRSGGGRGAAEARNIGMSAASGEFLAFLDDDDVWLAGHLQTALKVLQAEARVDIYCARALVLDDEGAGRIEPTVLIGDRTLTQYFFERAMWRSRSRRVATPTLVFRRRLSDHRMDSARSVNEDTWWLLTAERDRGARVVQSAHVAVVVHGSRLRTSDRQAKELGDWLDDIDALSPGAAITEQLWMYGRPAVRSGRPDLVVDAAREMLRRPRGWTWLPVIGAFVVGATAVRAGQVAHRLPRVAKGKPSAPGMSGARDR